MDTTRAVDNGRRALPGHFYAVGIGPGAPDLLTVRARGLVASADVLVAPRSERSRRSLALACVQDLLRDQEVVEQSYPMRRDAEGTRACWRGVANRVRDWCGGGRSVVQVTLGDPLIYSTSSYLLAALAGMLPPERVHVVPGVSAFQAAASRLGECLAVQEDRVTIMPGTDVEAVARALGECEMLVLYKVSRTLPAIKELLARRGLLAQARLACYVEQGEREVLLRDLQPGGDERRGYLATLLVRTGSRPWKRE